MKRYAIALGLALLLPCLAAVPEIDKAKASGSPTATIIMEVFASYDCPHCKDLHETTIQSIMRDYVNNGKIYLVNREFPLSGQYHPFARAASTIAVAAARIGKYQQVSEALFHHQASWTYDGKVWEAVATAVTPAELKKLQSLANDPGVTAEVQREYDEGVALGVTSTPTVFITQGTRHYPIPGQQLNYTLLKSLLDGMLK